MERSGSSDGKLDADCSGEHSAVLGDPCHLEVEVHDEPARRPSDNPFLSDLTAFEAILAGIGEVCVIDDVHLSNQAEESSSSRLTGEFPETEMTDMECDPGSTGPCSSNLSPLGLNDSDTQSAGHDLEAQSASRKSESSGNASPDDSLIGTPKIEALPVEDNGKPESYSIRDAQSAIPGTSGHQPSGKEGLNAPKRTEPSKSLAAIVSGIGAHVLIQPDAKTSMEETTADSPACNAEPENDKEAREQREPPSKSTPSTDTVQARPRYRASSGKNVEHHSSAGVPGPSTSGTQPMVDSDEDDPYVSIDVTADVPGALSSPEEYRMGAGRRKPKGMGYTGFVSNARILHEKQKKLMNSYRDDPILLDYKICSIEGRLLCPKHSVHRARSASPPQQLKPFSYLNCLSTPSNMDSFRSSTPVNDPSTIVSEPTTSDPVSHSSAINPGISINTSAFCPDLSAVDPNADETAACGRGLFRRLLNSELLLFVISIFQANISALKGSRTKPYYVFEISVTFPVR